MRYKIHCAQPTLGIIWCDKILGKYMYTLTWDKKYTPIKGYYFYFKNEYDASRFAIVFYGQLYNLKNLPSDIGTDDIKNILSAHNKLKLYYEVR